MNAKVKALSIAAALATTALIAPKAEAANRYGLVCIHNPTDSTVNYLYHWGADGWANTSVAPGQTRYHSFAYDYANQNASPRLFVRFDADLSSQVSFAQYELGTIAAAPSRDCDRYGQDYVFVNSGSLGLDLVEW